MANYKSEILIEDEVVWSSTESVSQRTLTLNVARFFGRKNLKLRIKRLPDGPGPPPPPDPWDSNPLAHWWWWPDPNQVANQNQRMYTSAPVELYLDDFTVVACFERVVMLPDSGWLVYRHGMDQINPWVSKYCHSTQFDFTVQYRMHGITSNDGASPGQRCEILSPNPIVNGYAMVGYSYEKIVDGASKGYLYAESTGSGVLSDINNLMEAPPFHTVKPAVFFGYSNPALGVRSVYGRTYWVAIYAQPIDTPARMHALYAGTTKPWEEASLVYYVDFSQTPAATITPNVDTLGVGDLTIVNWANVVQNGP